jgi:hypothetical protein
MVRLATEPKLTFKQQLAVFNLIRKGREILSSGEITASAAEDFGRLADWAERECNLPAVNVEFERDLDALRAVRDSDPQWRDAGR